VYRVRKKEETLRLDFKDADREKQRSGRAMGFFKDQKKA
jgi:hypothetical protein